MKKIIFSFLLFLSLVIPQYSSAQQIDCSVVDAGNSQDCCIGRNYAINQNACDKYLSTINEGPTSPGNTVGETITVPNNFGMCNSYRWDGTKWVKTNVDPFICSLTAGDECSIIDDFNYQNCCLERTGNAIQCKKYTDAGGMGLGGSGIFGTGDPNTNPQNSGTPPATNTTG